MAPDDGEIYEFGTFRLDARGSALYGGGRPVALKPKAFDLLTLLIGEPGRVFGKDELMERLWPDTFVEEANLTQTVYELRRALGETAREPQFIENVPKRGYRFVGELKRLGPTTADNAGAITSIAVLVFRPLVEGSRDESLELGIAETLATGLSGLGRWVVRPISAVRRFAGPEQDPLAAARSLGVDAVLHGTIQHASGNRLRVAARLDHTRGGPPLWAGQFDEHADDLFALQDSLLEKMLAALSVTLTKGEQSRLSRQADANPEVHRLFLKCRYHWHKWTPENWRRSIEYGEQVIALSPSHAEAHAWVSAGYCTLGIFGILRPREAFEKARSYVLRALELDPESSKAFEILAAIKLFFDWDWRELPAAFERATGLDPNNATAFNLWSLFEASRGRFDAAIDRIDRALDIDPLSLVTNTDRGFVLLYSGRPEAALDQFARSLDLDPFFAHAHYGSGYARLAMGETEAGREHMLAGARFEGTEPGLSAEAGYAAARCGDRAAAVATIGIQKERGKRGYVDPYRIALIYAGLRDREGTLEYIKLAFDNRSRELIYLACHPAFEWLRDDADFKRFITRLGL